MMGFGLMGAGSAVKGLVSGYQQGRKFAQDEERFDMEKQEAEQRKRLRESQIEGVGLANRKIKGELDDADFDRQVDDDARKIIDRHLSGGASSPAGAAQTVSQAPSSASVGASTEGAAPAAGIANPAASAPPSSMPAQAGIAPPGGAPAPAPLPRSQIQVVKDLNAELLNNQLRKRNVDRGAILRQAIESARFFDRAETQATVDATTRFMSGVPQEQIFAEMRAQGHPIQDGTTMSMVDGKDPYTGAPTKDVVISLPNGQTVSRNALLPQLLEPHQLLSHQTALGKVFAEVKHYEAVQENQREHNRIVAQGQLNTAAQAERHHKEMMARFAEQQKQNSRMFKLNEEKFAWDKIELGLQRTQKQFEDLYGYTRLTEADRLKLENGNPGDPKKGILSDLELAERRSAQRLNQVTTGMTLYEMNRDPATNRPLASPAEIKGTIDMMLQARKGGKLDEVVKTDDLGRAYVNFQGKRILVPKDEAASAPAAAPAPPPAPTSQSAAAPAPRPGIAPPRNQLPPQAEQAGAAVDAARAKVAAATTTLQRFGLRQQQQDPNGFAAARQALDAARSELSQAESAYQGALPAGLSQAFSR